MIDCHVQIVIQGYELLDLYLALHYIDRCLILEEVRIRYLNLFIIIFRSCLGKHLSHVEGPSPSPL